MPSHRVTSLLNWMVCSPTRVRASALFFQCFRFRVKRVASVLDVSNSTALSLAHHSLHLARPYQQPNLLPHCQPGHIVHERKRSHSALDNVDLCNVDGEEDRRHRGPPGGAPSLPPSRPSPTIFTLLSVMKLLVHPTRFSSGHLQCDEQLAVDDEVF